MRARHASPILAALVSLWPGTAIPADPCGESDPVAQLEAELQATGDRERLDRLAGFIRSKAEEQGHDVLPEVAALFEDPVAIFDGASRPEAASTIAVGRLSPMGVSRHPARFRIVGLRFANPSYETAQTRNRTPARGPGAVPDAPVLPPPLFHAGEASDEAPAGEGRGGGKKRIHGNQPTGAILARLAEARHHLDRALAAVTDDQAAALHRLVPELLDRTSNGNDLEELVDGPVLAEIARAIDPAGLQRVADLLAGLADRELAASLAAELAELEPIAAPEWLAEHVTGTILHAERTDHGTVIIGGPGPNRYTGRAHLIIDVGGDDEYRLAPGDRVRAIIDLAGADTHIEQRPARVGRLRAEPVSRRPETHRPHDVGLRSANPTYETAKPLPPQARHGTAGSTKAPGTILAASILVDHAGDDEYTGGMVAQGASVAGVALLIDHAGNDRYTAAELAQGASLAGIGMLVDGAGDDVYTAAKFAQGFGGTLGTGILRDRAGNDRYTAGGKHASSYEIPGRFQAFSQGVGMGFRNDVAGGTGLLHDLGGDDEYRAGNFAQGTGYYLGIGRLVDEAGSDRYFGARYAQGAAAHLGIGILDDHHGNDTYHGTVAATQAGAWHLALAAFVDRAGNDTYAANEFALGAAAQIAIAFFVDACGEDEFTARRETRGHTGPTDYHDEGEVVGNLAVFISAMPASSAPRPEPSPACRRGPGRRQ